MVLDSNYWLKPTRSVNKGWFPKEIMNKDFKSKTEQINLISSIGYSGKENTDSFNHWIEILKLLHLWFYINLRVLL